MTNEEAFSKFLKFYSETSSLFTALEVLLNTDEQNFEMTIGAKKYLDELVDSTGIYWQDIFAQKWLQVRNLN